LSKIVDFRGKVAGIGGGAFENSLGGRVAVMGYSPWSMIQTLAKTTQLKTVIRWLSRDSLPCYVASYHKAVLWCRRNPAGRLAMFVLNNSLDQADEMRVNVLEDRPFRVVRPARSDDVAPVVARDGPYAVLELPALGPWEMALLL
jgi:hypothetical protein